MRIQEASPSTGSAESAASTAGAVSPAPLRLLPALAPEPLPEPDESARAVLDLARSHGVDMPITAGVVTVVEGAASVAQVTDALLARPRKAEGVHAAPSET